MRPLGEQIALITGATKGLGRTVAGELASAGATVLLHGQNLERSRNRGRRKARVLIPSAPLKRTASASRGSWKARSVRPRLRPSAENGPA